MTARDLFVLVSRFQRSGRNPLAVYLLALCVTAAVSFVAGMIAGTGGMKPVEKLMPTALVLAWYVLLFSGATVALVGIALRDLVSSLLVERGGQYALTAAGTVYSLSLLSLHQWLSAGVTLAFAGACLARAWQIRRELKQIKAPVE